MCAMPSAVGPKNMKKPLIESTVFRLRQTHKDPGGGGSKCANSSSWERREEGEGGGGVLSPQL